MRRIEDLEAPNLLRHTYPAHQLPLVTFPEPPLEARVPPAAWCIDVTLSQGSPLLDTLDSAGMMDFYQILCRINGRGGLLKRMELKMRDDSNREVLTEMLRGFHRRETLVEPVVMFNPEPGSLSLIQGLQLREVGVSVPVSDRLLAWVAKVSRTQAVTRLFEQMDALLAEGVQIRLDLQDVTRSDINGFLLPLLERCLDRANQGVGLMPLKLRLCDSMGLGLPWAEAPLPRSVPRLINLLTRVFGFQPGQMEFQGHNDLGMALPNNMAAVMHGCSGVACSLGGIGERGGLTPLELMLVHLGGLYGHQSDLTLAQEGLSFLKNRQLEFSPRQPLWGADALKNHGVGAEAEAAADHPQEFWAPVDTEFLLNRLPR